MLSFDQHPSDSVTLVVRRYYCPQKRRWRTLGALTLRKFENLEKIL